MSRLGPQPAERIDRSKKVKFKFDGKSVSGYEGDTIASALYAQGQRIFSRSFKYHRPRGIVSASGWTANTLVQDGEWPGIRATTERATEGMQVKHMNAWPSLNFDVMRASDIFGGPFMPAGFYYKTFIWPRSAWPLYEKVLRNAAGLGVMKKSQAHREWRTDYRRRHCDVLVIGGGIAGLSAAIAAAREGADVVLIDEDVEPGGQLLWQGHHEQARKLTEEAKAAGVEIMSNAPALGYFDGMVPVWQGSTLHQIRAQRHVAATGSIEQPLVFPNNDLPGVMLSTGAIKLAALYALKPGENAVIATTGDRGLEAALALHAVGVNVAAVADLLPNRSNELTAAIEAAGIQLLRGMTVVEATGNKHLKGCTLAEIDAKGIAKAGTEERFDCDLLVVSGGTVPASSLMLQAGAKAKFNSETNCFLPENPPPGIHPAGAVAGKEELEAAALSGTLAGARAAQECEFGDGSAANAAAAALEELPAPSPAAPSPAYQRTATSKGKAFLDLDEDVTTKDMKYAIEEGYDSIELSKRYTTVTMGPSQGRISQLPSVRMVADQTGLSIDETGITTARPPWSTVPLGAWAGRPFTPAKRSAIHARQRELNSHVKWAGDWRRAYDYGDVKAEAAAVHNAVGMIDVSTLGKMIVSGPEAGKFLDRMYTNRLSDLKVGRIRYGILGNDAGRITDDGTVCRVSEDSFLVTTTSAGADAVERWFTWWLAAWEMEVHVTDVTQGLCAVNVAGPKARDLLGKLTDADLTNDGFGYLDGHQIQIAGVQCLAMRIGFVGELGYEIHYPAACGQYLWDQILEAGAEYGIKPFGLEPQRILRLEKAHIIVGQDTDSESNAYESQMGWIVKLDKEEDFMGKWALERANERGMINTLVGFKIDGDDVPIEGSAVVVDGQPAGRVTSSRYSELLGQSIGLAWVPAEHGKDGGSLHIKYGNKSQTATVVHGAFYDPDQERLRS